MQKGNSVKWLGGKDDPRGLKKNFFNGKFQDSLCNVYIRVEKSTEAHWWLFLGASYHLFF